MRAFAEAHPNEAIVHQLGAQIPWKHNCAVLDKFKNHEQRIWYIQKTIKHGRNRSVLIHQIETDLYNRQGGALMNYEMSDG
jgi:predicted nuclease of restriction endonuclease-like (RecB) superfamily